MIETPVINHRKHVNFVDMKFRAWEDRQEELLELKLYEFWGIAEEAIQQLKDEREEEKQLKEKDIENGNCDYKRETSLHQQVSETFFEQVWELKLGSIWYSEKDKTFGPNGIECTIMKSPNDLFTEGKFNYSYKSGSSFGGKFNCLTNDTAYKTLEESQEEILKKCIVTHEYNLTQAPEDIKLGKLIQHLQGLLNTIKGGVVKEASGQLSFF